MQAQVDHPDHSEIHFERKREKIILATNESSINVEHSSMDIVIRGNRNRVKIFDSAARLRL